MKRKIFVAMVFLLLCPVGILGLDAVTFYPDVVSRDTPVTIIGGPFDAEVMIRFGDRLIAPRRVGDRQLVFVVPDVEPGAYAFSLVEATRESTPTLALQVVLPPPVIHAITPQRINECYEQGERDVVLLGENFQPGARLLLNNLAVPFERSSDSELQFNAPQLSAGIYGVQVVNPDGRTSLPHSLEYNNTPEILEVTTGKDFVNYYQLIIRGRNFYNRSMLVVSEYPVGFSDLPPQQRAIRGRGVPGPWVGDVRKIGNEELYYKDCHTLIYNRFPLSGQQRRVILRVSNPDGKQTSSYELTIP